MLEILEKLEKLDFDQRPDYELYLDIFDKLTLENAEVCSPEFEWSDDYDDIVDASPKEIRERFDNQIEATARKSRKYFFRIFFNFKISTSKKEQINRCESGSK